MRIPTVDLNKTGQNICILRKQSGISVKKLQELLGFATPQAIYKWQHGECLPTVDNLLALARLLRVNMEDLLVWNDPEVLPFFGDPPKTSAARKGTSFPCRFFYCALSVRRTGSPDTARRRRSAPCWHRDPPGPS